jgi:hypothetical protein
MTTTLILVLVILGLAIYLVPKISYRKKSKSTSARKTATPKVRRSRYQAVSISYGPNACDAARAVKDKRFRVAEAPLTPLPECTSAMSCSCKYVHYEDRRSNKGDRRLPAALSSELFESTGRANKRQMEGRRTTDFSTA